MIDDKTRMNTASANAPDLVLELTSQMQKVLDYIKANGQITDKEIGEQLGIKKTRIFNIAKQMQEYGLIQAVGRGKEKKYTLTKYE